MKNINIIEKMLKYCEKIYDISNEWKKTKLNYNPEKCNVYKLKQIYFYNEKFQKEIRIVLEKLSKLANLLDINNIFYTNYTHSTDAFEKTVMLAVREYSINSDINSNLESEFMVFSNIYVLQEFLKNEIKRYEYYNEVNKI